MKFYSSRLQWIVIWGIALAALWMWIEGSTPLQAHDRRIVALVVVGVLIVWMLSDLGQLREVVDWYEKKHQAFVLILLIVVGTIVAALVGWLPDVGPRTRSTYSFSRYRYD